LIPKFVSERAANAYELRNRTTRRRIGPSVGFLPAAPRLILPAMDDRPKRTQKASQKRRLGAALRENLKRRKAQAKGRASAPGTDPEDDPKADDKSHDSAGIAGHKQPS
jgi:hypothetical protein